MDDSSHPDRSGNPLQARLTRVFVDILARDAPYFGGGGPGYYGVHVENIASDGSELDLIVILRAGEKYCCSQIGCHFPFGEDWIWSEIREDMDAHGLLASPLPTIRILRVVVEAGAKFDPGGLRFPPLISRGDVLDYGPFPPVTEPREEGEEWASRPDPTGSEYGHPSETRRIPE